MRVKALILLALFAGTLLFSSSTSSAFSINNSPKVIPVGAFYYLWYGYNYTSETWTGGLNNSHWNDTSGGIVKDEPSIGYYASDSNATLAVQIPEMLSAGINFVLVAWWGWGNTTLQSGGSLNVLDEAINNATLNLLKWIKANDSQMKVAIMVDAFNTVSFGEPQYAQIRNYVDLNFYIPYSSEIFYWWDRPLIAWFNPLDPIVEGIYHNSSFTDRVVGNNPYVQWVFWSGNMQFFQATNRTAAQYADYITGPQISSYDGEVGVLPRYDDYYLSLAGSRPLYMRFDIYYSLGMYAYDWNYATQNVGKVNLVMIYSWNEYNEQSEIEPHMSFSNPSVSPTYLLNSTQYYINQLENYVPPSTQIYNVIYAGMFMVAVVAVSGFLFYLAKKAH